MYQKHSNYRLKINTCFTLHTFNFSHFNISFHRFCCICSVYFRCAACLVYSCTKSPVLLTEDKILQSNCEAQIKCNAFCSQHEAKLAGRCWSTWTLTWIDGESNSNVFKGKEVDYYTRHDVKLMVNLLYAEVTTKDIKSWKQHINSCCLWASDESCWVSQSMRKTVKGEHFTWATANRWLCTEMTVKLESSI